MLNIFISIIFSISLSNEISPREAFQQCKKNQKDCTFFKARVLEHEGNAGSAIELYLRGGYFDDLIRLKAYSGADISPLVKKYDIGKKKKLYYLGLAEFSRGNWNRAISFLSKRKLKNFTPAQFYLAYSFLMLAKIDKAKRILVKTKSDKLKALILYAENKQLQASKILLKVLKKRPDDFISRRYLAHIYYRTGWYKKAEKIYSLLIEREWRDTELYYLLNERCEMRTRNLKFRAARGDADRIIKEFPQRQDFIVEWIALLLEHDNLKLAQSYVSKLSRGKSKYQKSLYLLALGLVSEFKLKDKEALTYFKKAEEVYPAEEYRTKIKQSKNNLKSMAENKYPKLRCNRYKVKKIGSRWNIKSKKFGKAWPIKYFIESSGDDYKIALNLRFNYSKDLNFSNRSKRWIDFIEKFWSVHGVSLKIENNLVESTDNLINITVTPWPSSFYMKRTSSHEWSVLTSARMVSHEVGHLLGLDDEYYEMDKRVLWRNKGRYIGSRSSIMRNILSGYPQKRHIHFILSPIKCGKRK